MNSSKNSNNSPHSYGENYYDKPGSPSFQIAKIKANTLALSIKATINPSTSLDIGCGPGLLVYYLRQQGIAANGIDISDYAFSISPVDTREHLYKINIETEVLPFKDKSLDLVTAIEVLEHLDNPGHVIMDIRRILKPGGYLYITTPLPLINSKFGQFILGRGWKPLDITHVNVHNRLFWEKLVERNGFTYIGAFSKVFYSVPSEFWLVKILLKIPGGKTIRVWLTGTYLFQLKS